MLVFAYATCISMYQPINSCNFFFYNLVKMIQEQLFTVLLTMIITLGEATFGTLPPRPTTGTIYTILYYMFIL